MQTDNSRGSSTSRSYLILNVSSFKDDFEKELDFLETRLSSSNANEDTFKFAENEKLTLEQLSVDLYNGTGHVNNVALDVCSLNEQLAQARAPIEFIEGFIGSIVVSIPWSALLNENCSVEIKGLEMNLQASNHDNVDFAAMSDSFYRSLGSMTTSMELAEECLKGQEEGIKETINEGPGLFDGLEVFAQTIESVLSRVKISMIDTVIRFEHFPSNAKTGIGVQLNIARIEYFDEKTMSEENSGSQKYNVTKTKDGTYQRDVFACKRFQAMGITIKIDEFLERSRTPSQISSNSFQTGTPPNSKNSSIPICIHSDDSYENSSSNVDDVDEDDLYKTKPTIFACCHGQQEIKIRIKQVETAPGPTVDAECFLGSCSVFLTPHQVHLLTDFAEGFLSSTPQHMKLPKYAQEDVAKSPESLSLSPCEDHLTDHLGRNKPPNDKSLLYSNEQFFSMGNSQVISLAADLPPLGNPMTNTPLYFPNDENESEITDYTQHSYSTRLSSNTGTTLKTGSKYSQSLPTNLTQRYQEPQGIKSQSSKYQLKFSSLALTVLHINPLSKDILGNKQKNSFGSSCVDMEGNESCFKTSYSTMSEKYFTECVTSLGSLGSNEFSNIRKELSEVCCPHDHLRLLATQINLNCEQKCRKSRADLDLYSSTIVDLSIGKMELTESLFSNHNELKNLTALQQKKFEKCSISDYYLFHSELLCFMNKSSPISNFKSMYQTAVQNADRDSPNIKLRMNQTKQQKTSCIAFQVHLSECHSEVDISIIDRLSTLLNKPEANGCHNSTNSSVFAPQLHYTTANHNLHNVLNSQALFNATMDDVTENEDSKIDLTISGTQIKIKFLFPIPDLRPGLERRPWYMQSVRDEYLQFHLGHICLETALVKGGNIANAEKFYKDKSRESVKDFKFKMDDLHILYADEPLSPPQSFIRISRATNENEISVIENTDMDTPFIKVVVKPAENTTAYNMQLQDNSMFQAGQRFTQSNKNCKKEENIIEDDFPMLNSMGSGDFEQEFSPFSKKKHLYDGQEMVKPGTAKEMQAFIEDTSNNSKISISLNLPAVNIVLISSEFVNSLYNRVNNDLLLWEPTAPKPRKSQPISDGENYLSTINQLDIRTQLNVHNSDDFSNDETDSDEDTNYQETHFQKKFKKHNRPISLTKQSNISVTTTIGNGQVFIKCNDLKSKLFNKPPSVHGECILNVLKLSVFSVTSFQGNPLLNYVCILADRCTFHHKSNVPNICSVQTMVPPLNTLHPSNDLTPVVTKSSDEFIDSRGISSTNNDNENNMVLVAIKITTENDRPLKQCVIAANIFNATFHHKFLKPTDQWLEQIIDFFDVVDDSVLGYTPPSFLTELHIHLNDCAVVYEPVFMSPRMKTITTIGSFSLSSNLVSGAPLSVLHITIEDAALHLSNKFDVQQLNLRNYVTVLSINWFEICLRLKNNLSLANSALPEVDFQASNNEIRFTTCADSCAYLSALLCYLAEDGDLRGLSSTCDDTSDVSSLIDRNDIGSNETSYHYDMQNSEVKQKCNDKTETDLHDLMADAIKEKNALNKSNMMTESLYVASSSPEVAVPPKKDSDSEDDFCIISNSADEISLGEIDPVISQLHFDGDNEYIINIHENHFQPSYGKTDELRPPDHYPKPLYRYVLKELSCVWILYDGNDFDDAEGKDSSNLPKVAGRDQSTCMEIHLNKVRFQHDQYPKDTNEAARTVLILSDFEFLDRVKSSRINKFLYRFHTSSSPKQAHAKAFVLKALQIRPEGPYTSPECKLRVSLQPLRFNIDQDTLLFLSKFFSSISTFGHDYIEDNAHSFYETAAGSSISGVNHKSKKRYINPVMSRPPSALFIGEAENKVKETVEPANMEQPLFFKEIIFSPEVPIRLDYHGKRIDTEHGTFAGLLMGLGQLNCSQLKLKKVIHRHGLLGVDRVIMHLLGEWSGDIRSNQLPSILGGVGPMHSVVQIFQGMKDLIYLPVEQYRRDGRLMRGLQKGASSFGTSTAMALLEVTNKAVCIIQSAAETTYDIVSPAELHKRERNLQRNWRTLGYQATKKQPADLREGLSNAVVVMKDGFNDTAVTLVHLTQKEHERKGVTGAVGGILRQIPPTLVKPVIMASEATSSVLSGMRNQIQPDAKQENEDKWRDPLDD